MCKRVNGISTDFAEYVVVIWEIIDTPYFAGRKDTRMLQLADYVTYAVHRSYEHGDSGYLDKIMPLFKTTDTYYPDGLYHMTKNEDCDCDACYWRSARQP